MSATVGPISRRGVGRADLLRVIAAREMEQLALDDQPAGWFGYRLEPPQPAETTGTPPRPEPGPLAPQEAAGFRLPLQLPFLHALVARESLAPRPTSSVTAEPPVAPLQLEAIAPRTASRQTRDEDLVPNARLVPALRRQLSSGRPGALDIKALVDMVARRTVSRRLPRTPARRWHPDLVVVLHFSSRLWPYRADMHRLCALLLRHCGNAAVSLRVIGESPRDGWKDWVALRDWREQKPYPQARRWSAPPPGAAVLIVSDYGALAQSPAEQHQDWLRFVATLKRGGARPIGLAPVGARQVSKELAKQLPIVRWSPDGPMRPERIYHDATVAPDGLDELLAMASATPRIDPPLLRTLRRLTRAGGNAGLEGTFWAHHDVEAEFQAALRSSSWHQRAEQFRRLPQALQLAVRDITLRHHAHLRRFMEHLDTSAWGRAASRQAKDGRRSWQAEKKRQRDFVRSLVRSLEAAVDDRNAWPPEVDWGPLARAFLPDDDPEFYAEQDPVIDQLATALARLAAVRHQELALPAALTPQRIGDAPAGRVQQRWLVQDHATARLMLQARAPGKTQSLVVGPMPVERGWIRVRIGSPGRSSTHWPLPDNMEFELAPTTEPLSIELLTRTERMLVAPMERPRGVLAWGRRSGKLFMQSAPLGTNKKEWLEDELQLVPALGEDGLPLRVDVNAREISTITAGSLSPGMKQLNLGIDARYGAYADMRIATDFGSATQRFRYIEPGEFRMGSPEDEAERFDDEGPQHSVTLTRGFWLTDTACTQELWSVVMGRNPSRLPNNLQRPVEQVSWNDVQSFLRALESLLPGVHTDLPTEAEWEYACRAGTVTRYNFGNEFSAEKANIDRSPVPVRSYDPNSWGLYEMHGNVWEWCADNLRRYDGSSQIDPRGLGDQGKSASRAVRGGSWFLSARRARSASRLRFHRGHRIASLGFRFCLRSIEPGQVRPPQDEADSAGAERRPRRLELSTPKKRK